MIAGELRNKIDRIWETFWTGGITNPLDVIEQFTYLLFIKHRREYLWGYASHFGGALFWV